MCNSTIWSLTLNFDKSETKKTHNCSSLSAWLSSPALFQEENCVLLIATGHSHIQTYPWLQQCNNHTPRVLPKPFFFDKGKRTIVSQYPQRCSDLEPLWNRSRQLCSLPLLQLSAICCFCKLVVLITVQIPSQSSKINALTVHMSNSICDIRS